MRLRTARLAMCLVILACLLPVALPAVADTVAAQDTFGRTISNGWGSADIGGAYTLTGAQSSFSVSGGSGHILLASANANRAATLAGIAEKDVSLAFRVQPSRIATVGSTYVYAAVRQTAPGQIRAKIRFAPDGSVFAGATHVIAGTETDIAPSVKVSGLVAVAGGTYGIRINATGADPTTVSVRVWDAALVEPGTWTWSGTDATAEVQVAGATTVRGYLSSAATDGPVTLNISALVVTHLADDPPPPPPPTADASDDFARTVVAGLGSAPTGGAYTLTGKTADFGVDGGSGWMRAPAGGSRAGLLNGVQVVDSSMELSVSVSTLPVGGSAWAYLVLRHQASGSEYRAKVRLDPDGSVYVGLSRMNGTAEVTLTGTTIAPGVSVAGGQRIHLRFDATSASPTRLRLRAWSGATEPTAWQTAASYDGVDLQGAGAPGVRGYLASSTTNGPLTLRIDDLIVAPPAADPPPYAGPPAVMAGAGDISKCGSSGPGKTAALLDTIDGTVFTLGDDAYPNGAAADFACFNTTWGRFTSRMFPAPGNHEYNTPGATGYYDYFGALAGPRGLGYYAKDVGSWRIYVLNTECRTAGPSCSTQVNWLTADLAANPHQCVLAIWHEPRFSSGAHGDALYQNNFYTALYNGGADIQLSGHDHDYERFDPMDPTGSLDLARGIQTFVVGTGGVGTEAFQTVHANSVVRQTGTLGVLKLTLGDGTYDWQFLPVAGQTFTDSGTGTCH